jgi:hypothetical protein
MSPCCASPAIFVLGDNQVETKTDGKENTPVFNTLRELVFFLLLVSLKQEYQNALDISQALQAYFGRSTTLLVLIFQ